MIKKLLFFLGLILFAPFLIAQQIKSVSVCAGASISITANTDVTKTCQWQVKSAGSTSYSNISNSALYSGVTSGTLTITAPATSMVGYKFRCLITNQGNTSSSDITVLKFKAIWSGQADSVWNNSSNWNCGVIPDENTEIIIQPGAAHYPYINFNLTCRKLSMAPNASLHLLSGFKVNVTGNDTLLPESKAPQKLMVDSLGSVLLSTEAETETGLFRYNTFPGYKNITDGDFLIEPRNYGYLRKVEMVDSNSNGVSFYTSQGTISELYKDSGSISQTVIIPDANNPFIGPGGRSNKSNNPAPLAMKVPGFSISIPNGSIEFTNFFIKFNPNPTFDFNNKDKYLKAGFVNATYGFSFDAKITLELNNNTAPPETYEFDITDKIPAIKAFKLPFSFGAVFGHMEFHVVLRGKGKVSTNLQQTLHYEYTANRNAYIKRENGVTDAVFNSDSPVTVFEPSTREWQLNSELGVEMDLLPKIFLYRIPFINIGISGSLDFKSAINLDNHAWDAGVSYVIGGKANTKKTLFSFLEPINVTMPFFEPKFLWKAPLTLNIVSGADQTGKINTDLPQPVVLQVLDSFDNNIPGVRVFFSSNKGSWEKAYVTTDGDGKASNKFTFGNTEEEHELTAVIKKADNTIIKTVIIKLKPGSAPVVSTAAISTITDLTAVSGGSVTTDGGSPISARGVCWNTTGGPTAKSTKTNNGNGLGSFTSNIAGLTPNTTYYVRAYAINITDTAYGAEISFKTEGISDTVATLVAHGIWKAISGFGIGGLITVHQTDEDCGADLEQYGKTDSLHLLFNSDRTGFYYQWDHQWGDSMTAECIVKPYDYYETHHYSFTWQYLPALKSIRIYFNTPEFYIFDILQDEPADFNIQLFNSDQMKLVLPGEPWGYEGISWEALFE